MVLFLVHYTANTSIAQFTVFHCVPSTNVLPLHFWYSIIAQVVVHKLAFIQKVVMCSSYPEIDQIILQDLKV